MKIHYQFFDQAFGPDILLPDFLALVLAFMIIYRYPSGNKWRLGMLICLPVLCLLCSFLFKPGKACAQGLALMAWTCAINIHQLCGRVSKPRALFKNSSVWASVECASFSSLQLLYLLALGFSLAGGTVPAILSAMVAVFVMACLVRKQKTGHCFMVTEEKEKLIKNIAKGDLRGPQIYEDSTGNKKMNSLYDRAVEYMDKQAPYLDEYFSLDEFSRILYTNKVYLSRTINVYSGRNFRQFINYYRVKHSIELMKKDPRLKVEELATMSGFHSYVSYNMAFRLFMNETPKEWMHNHRLELLEELNSSPARRQGSGDVNL